MPYTFQISKHAKKRMEQRKIILPWLHNLKKLNKKERAAVTQQKSADGTETYFKGKKQKFLGTPIYVCVRLKSRFYKVITAFYIK